MPITTIQIVRSGQQPFDRVPYMIHPLTRHWRDQGLNVEIVHALLDPAGAGVLVMPHIDLTVRPASFAEPIARSANVINRAVIDVSKRAISGQLVTGPDQHDGPVLVKSNRNYGGLPERMVRSADPAAPAPHQPFLHWSSYTVYDHPRQVPPMVWHYPPLVVEKFLPEMADGLYCLRQYSFLGDSYIHTRAYSSAPIVKSRNVVRREVLEEPPPPQVLDVRRRFGFDYGKFDFVIHEGEAIVFDVNPTPTYNPHSKSGSQDELIAHIANGIHSFVKTD